MALTRLLIFVVSAALPLLFSLTEAGEMGVNYGRVANNLPDPSSVVRLLKDNGITRVKIFDADDAVLRSLANTGIKVMVMMPNDKVADAANNPSIAGDWVWNHVAVYLPATQIHGVAVGNEVFDSAPGLTHQLVQAMKNVQAALANLGLADTIKVSTPIAFSAVTDSFPPSAGRFRDDLAWPVMKPMLDFLQGSGSYLTMNIYPFFAFNNPANQINRDYAVGNPNNPGVPDHQTGLMYHSLLDAQLDATYYAMEKLGFSSVKLCLTETGWPSGGQLKMGNHMEARIVRSGAATLDNAQAYNNNLIKRVLSGKTGTPHHPNADMDVYIFALFNENQKGQGPDDIEQHFGLFYPNKQKVYDFDFHGGGDRSSSWCVANPAVGDARLQAALDWACGNGADCGPIQPGAKCFEPNTIAAHASHAFNSYYQRNRRAPGTCDFSGTASVVFHAPKIGNCVLPLMSPLEETTPVSDGSYAAL